MWNYDTVEVENRLNQDKSFSFCLLTDTFFVSIQTKMTKLQSFFHLCALLKQCVHAIIKEKAIKH
jgi:hypothetical protein